MLSNQKIWVSAIEKGDNPTQDYVDRITILGKEAIEDTYIDLHTEVVQENDDFVFFTPENVRYLMIQLHEKAASAGFVFGTFIGFQPNNSVGSNLGLSITAEGIPLSITYNFEIGDGFTLGEEKIEFSEWGSAELPTHIDFDNIGLWNAPTNWKEEFTPDLYKEVANMFGEEHVLEISYLFSKE